MDQTSFRGSRYQVGKTAHHPTPWPTAAVEFLSSRRGVLRWAAICLMTAVTASTVEAEPDRIDSTRAAALEFARTKWGYLLNHGSEEDPVGATPSTYCQRAATVRLGSVCGTDLDLATYLIDVTAPWTHGRIQDVVVVNHALATFSLNDIDGFTRLISESTGRCDTAGKSWSLVELYLRIVFDPADESWKPVRMCRTSKTTSSTSICLPPEIDNFGLGETIHVSVLGRRAGERLRWERWHFTYSGGRFAAGLDETPDESDGRTQPARSGRGSDGTQ